MKKIIYVYFNLNKYFFIHYIYLFIINFQEIKRINPLTYYIVHQIIRILKDISNLQLLLVIGSLTIAYRRERILISPVSTLTR